MCTANKGIPAELLYLSQAQHNKGVVGEHGAALACWSTALQESQSICGVLQKDREHQAASQASQHAELCDALDSTGIQTAESLGESLQTLEHMRTAWQSRYDRHFVVRATCNVSSASTLLHACSYEIFF